jgi:3alpha(or 20beta)-hydroxysteroid dehydrogenase
MTGGLGGDLGLKDRVVVITGAAGGQGASTARLFAGLGAHVVVTDLNGGVRAVAAEIGGLAIEHDVAEETSWDAVVMGTVERFGRVDVLINNAGVYHRGSIAETPPEKVRTIVAVNEIGPLLGIRAVTPALRAAGGGAIVNISSTGGLSGGARASAYAMTKWALRGLTRCAAAELAEYEVRVNCVLPGLVDTGMAAINGDDVNARMLDTTFLRRMGSSDEVANATVFLASSAASYITGADLVVDGGLSV